MHKTQKKSSASDSEYKSEAESGGGVCVSEQNIRRMQTRYHTLTVYSLTRFHCHCFTAFHGNTLLFSPICSGPTTHQVCVCV